MSQPEQAFSLMEVRRRARRFQVIRRLDLVLMLVIPILSIPILLLTGWEAAAVLVTIYVLLVVFGSIVVLVASNCPMCGKWVHPIYYPREKVHCPHCGRALPPETPTPPGN